MGHAGTIRAIVIGVFRDGRRILAGEGYDRVKGEAFLRPPGGGIHFGESSAEALVREVREELGREISDLCLLGVLENRFACEGEAGHEVVFVYDARFVDGAAYEAEWLAGRESNGEGFRAVWVDLDAVGDGAPLYPDGLAELLRASARRGGRVPAPRGCGAGRRGPGAEGAGSGVCGPGNQRGG